jgi:alpha,alpha-trehalose phosphorylase
MTSDAADTDGPFLVEPWHLRSARLDPSDLATTESLFALSNGHIGLRGNLDEGEPHGLPGTYLNSFYELRPLPHAEAGYGYPESGQTIVNVTNGKPMRLLVDDEPFDIRYGELRHHERALDLRSGLLSRSVEWCSPARQAVRIRTVRLVSFTQRAIAAIRYEVEPVDEPARIILQSELVANEEMPPLSGDPRVAADLAAPLVADEQHHNEYEAMLLHHTAHSGLRLAAGMDHVVEGPQRTDVTTVVRPDWGRTTIACVLEPGQKLTVVKFLGYGWSSQRSRPALRDQVDAALTAAKFAGWDGLVADQRAYLDQFWAGADVRLEGDPEVQQAVRFALFHVLQAGARAEHRPIGAKGLTGNGYDGHVFWDTEMFALPVLTYTVPRAAADVLRWRHSTLDLARDRAKQLRQAGAAFPWRTIRGQECSGYWPAGTAAFHIGAAVADATVRYYHATGDETFLREVGIELLVETARLWRSLGHHDRSGRFHLDGMTGPDEYSALGDDNVYTNLMAARNLTMAATLGTRFPEVLHRLGVDDEEAASWHDAAAAMHVPFDHDLGVHQQSENFTRFQEWDFANTSPEDYPLLMNMPYFDLYRKQVVKQADLVLAMHWRGDAFTPEEKARNFAYYEARTVRDSSLSAATQAVLAAEVGHLELAHDYIAETSLVDLRDVFRNSRDGVHIASLSGSWLGIVAGLGGLRDHDGVLSFSPRLPSRIDRLEFSILWRGTRLRVAVVADEATYTVDPAPAPMGPGSSYFRTDSRTPAGDSEPVLVDLVHHGEPISVRSGYPVTRPIPPAQPLTPRPAQPPGRAPHRSFGP